MPTEPVNVQVHQALGKEPEYGVRSFDIAGVADYELIIPAYDADPAAALGALEEYCRRRKPIEQRGGASVRCDYQKAADGWEWFVELGSSVQRAPSLPAAVCAAILAHAKGR